MDIVISVLIGICCGIYIGKNLSPRWKYIVRYGQYVSQKDWDEA